jgi:hypothetical protein
LAPLDLSLKSVRGSEQVTPGLNVHKIRLILELLSLFDKVSSFYGRKKLYRLPVKLSILVKSKLDGKPIGYSLSGNLTDIKKVTDEELNLFRNSFLHLGKYNTDCARLQQECSYFWVQTIWI